MSDQLNLDISPHWKLFNSYTGAALEPEYIFISVFPSQIDPK